MYQGLCSFLELSGFKSSLHAVLLLCRTCLFEDMPSTVKYCFCVKVFAFSSVNARSSIRINTPKKATCSLLAFNIFEELVIFISPAFCLCNILPLIPIYVVSSIAYYSLFISIILAGLKKKLLLVLINSCTYPVKINNFLSL